MTKKTAEPAITFEAAVARLSEIVNALEKGEAALDESIALFEEGARLTGHCRKLLKEAEQKVLKLTSDNGETPFQEDAES